ncbi:MAG: hypothetical protein AB7V18_19070 [Pyrinomonadaceae bacterium]
MLPRTATTLYCQRCGTSYAISDADARHHFKSSSTFSVGDLASPAAIAALVPTEEIEYCPTCEEGGELFDRYKRTEPIKESPFFVGQSRMTGEEEADVKARQAELDSAKHDPDVTHDTRE